MSSYQGEIFGEFFKTEHGKEMLKTAQAEQKMGPTDPSEVKKVHPSGGEDTEVSSGASAGDEGYKVPQESVGGDTHVETIEEVAKEVEEVARREPTGKEGNKRLVELVKIANDLDNAGLTEEAEKIDEIIKEESGLSVEAFFHPEQYEKGGEKKEEKKEDE